MVSEKRSVVFMLADTHPAACRAHEETCLLRPVGEHQHLVKSPILFRSKRPIRLPACHQLNPCLSTSDYTMILISVPDDQTSLAKQWKTEVPSMLVTDIAYKRILKISITDITPTV
ncbi:hypothetical protein [Phyllobacterium sp. SB3]|uniref:hypothetical protein n=1 Tax=Phyllobacterium sp. SB3 TaxID=3156073 RepID=UPI0032B00459